MVEAIAWLLLSAQKKEYCYIWPPVPTTNPQIYLIKRVQCGSDPHAIHRETYEKLLGHKLETAVPPDTTKGSQ